MTIDFFQKVVGLKTQKEKVEADRKRSFWLWLTPNKKEGETEKTTVVRMLFDPANPHGQTDPMPMFGLHEGISQVNPQTGCRVYPGLPISVKTAICLNTLANDKLGPGNHDFCEVCRDEVVLRDVNKSLKGGSDAKLERAYGMFFNGFKSINWVAFVALRRTTSMQITAKGGNKEAGMIPLNAKGKIVDADSAEIKAWADPICLVRIKEYFCDGDGGNFYTMLSQRSMTKTEFEAQIGRMISSNEYLDKCPSKHAHAPFDPDQGWAFEIHVHGQGLKRRMEFTACTPSELKAKDKCVVKQAYPNLVKEITPFGMDRVKPLTDEGWKAHFEAVLKERKQTPALYPEDPAQRHTFYTMIVLQDAQHEMLGVNQHKAILTLAQAKGKKVVVSSESGGDVPYSLDDDVPEAPTKGTETDDLELEDGIPF